MYERKMVALTIAAALTATLWTLAESPQEGLTLHRQSSTSGAMSMEGTSQSKMYLDDRHVRQVSGSEELIIFFRESRFVRIDHADQTYSEATFEELQEKLDRVSDELSEKADEHQQAFQTIQDLHGGKAGKISVEKLGPGPEIAGFETVKYEIQMPPLTVFVWSAPALEVPEAYYESMKIHAKPNPLFDMAAMFEAFKEIEGFSMRTEVVIQVMGMEARSIDEVVRVERGPVPKPQIPTDYEKVELDF